MQTTSSAGGLLGRGVIASILALALGEGSLHAQIARDDSDNQTPLLARMARVEYREPTGTITSIGPADGREHVYTTENRWRPMCGSAPGLTNDDLKRNAENHARQMADAPNIVVIDTPRQGASTRASAVNIVFVINASGAPAGYATSFTLAEQYIESKFTDPVTVTINVSWANLGSGIIGQTGSNYVNGVSYTNSRNALVNNQDSNDTIQDFLPTGSSVPVRFNATSATITNVSSLAWTRANYRAAGLGSPASPDANMTFNSTFGFDFDPTNGVGGGLLSLTDTVVHEVGHALGFVSEADSTATTTINPLDLFRFARGTRSGVSNTNPASTADFQTFAREVDLNNPTNDDVNSDIISNEWRMSDGSPYQASHFFQANCTPATGATGIMQPALCNGSTFYPNYFMASDLAMLDAIGWDDTIPCSPNITTQPSGTSACVGGPFSVSIVASGTGLSYQWKKGGADIAGATGTSYSVASAQLSDIASYTCVVSNTCGSVTSNGASVVVTNPPSIGTHPSNINACYGTLVTMSVAATGDAPLTYQWRKNGIDIPTAHSTSYSILGVTEAHAGAYDCVVTNPCTSVTSNPATLSVLQLPEFSSQPTSQIVCAGSSVTFTATVASTPIPALQWKKDGVNIPGATSDTYQIPAVTSGDAADYTCVATTSCSSATSDPATLSVNPGPLFNSGPSPQSVCAGQPFSFSVSAVAASTFQWRKNTVNIPGANSSAYSGIAAQSDAGSYDCVITNSCATITSSAATLSVDTGPSITLQPSNTSVGSGAVATFTVAATGAAPVTFQWRKDSTNLTDTGAYTGTTSATISIDPATAAEQGSYDCVITDACLNTTSNAALLSISSCPADLDNGSGSGVTDGGVDISDLLFFLNKFEGGDIVVDLDNDGVDPQVPDGGVDISDLLYFLLHFEGGC